MKRGATNNKGFSLVELIIVIAIMAILVGVMAPQLIKYIEKANVSADIQLCDNIHRAFEVAFADYDVISDPEYYSHYYVGYFRDTVPLDTVILAGADCYKYNTFTKAIGEVAGFNPFAESGNEYFKSTPAKNSGELHFKRVSQSEFYIYIDHSDKSAGKQDYTGADMDKVICSPTYNN